MPRTFKISFPLPGRKSRDGSEDINANVQHTYYNDIDDHPHCDPGIKAEQVLGTNSPSPVPNIEKPPFWSRKPRKYSSFMSVTVSDYDADSIVSRDHARQPYNVGGIELNRHLDLHRNLPSPTLLGETDSLRSQKIKKGTIPRLQGAQSTSTMNSLYSRKCEPPSSTQNFVAPRSPRTSNLTRQGYGLQCLSPEDGSRDVHEVQQFARPKPLALDLKGLYDLPHVVPPSVSSPHLYSKESTQISSTPVRHSSGLGRGKWLGSDWVRKSPALNRARSFVRSSSADKPEGRFVQRNEKSTTHSPHQWLHEVGEAESPDEIKHEDLVGYPLSEDPISSLISGRKDVFQRRKNSISRYDHSLQAASASALTKSRSNTLESTISSEMKSVTSNVSVANGISSTSNCKIPSLVDRLNQSVLSLSSSDDEGDDTHDRKPHIHHHRIRESVDKFDRGDQAFVSDAQRVTTSKPRPIVHSRSSRKSRSNSSELVPPVPSIPARPLPAPRVSSIHWQEHMKSQNALKVVENSSSTASKSLSTHDCSIVHSRSNSQQRRSSLAGKLIAVTPEEKMLLEHMRRKRASIQTESSSEGRSIASLIHGDKHVASRPKTSGFERMSQEIVSEAGGVPSHSGYDLARTLNGPYSVSADSLPRHEAIPVSQTTSISGRPPSLVSTSNKRSPESSFGLPDLLPSPTSRHSPRTPPPDYSLRLFTKGTSPLPQRSLSLGSKGTHKRERTISSGVVVLDGAEQKAQQLDDEDAIAGWAIDHSPW